MATANLVQRTFGKGFSISDSTPLTVSCVDSGGNLIKCNYLGISVNPGVILCRYFLFHHKWVPLQYTPLQLGYP